MSADLYNKNSFFSLREMPWHGQGYVAPEPMTIDQVLAVTDTDYAYEKVAISATSITPDGVSVLPIEDKMAMTRRHPVTNEVSYIGIVGEGYQPHTPRHLSDFNDTMLGMNIPIETYGLLGDRGQRMFLTYRLPGEITIGGRDVTNMYLFVSTAFDGSLATQFRVCGVRVVCANTWVAAIGDSMRQTAKIRHSSLLDGKVQAVREALDMAWEQAKAMEELGNRLLEMEVTKPQVKNLIKVVFPSPEDTKVPSTTGEKRAATNAAERRNKVWELLHADTNKDYLGSAWGVYNAFTEFADHESKVRTEGRRLEMILDGDTAAMKNKVLGLLLSA